MSQAAGLPLPQLSRGRFAYALGPDALDGRSGWVSAYTDESLMQACGVRIAFTERSGGCSGGPFGSLNLKPGLGDEDTCVARNVAALLSAFGADATRMPLVCPNQVHGTAITEILDERDLALAKEVHERLSRTGVTCLADDACLHKPALPQDGSDAALVCVEGAAALLCFADCLPLVLVAPTGGFCVVHCGWKGTVGHLAAKAAGRLAQASACDPATLNAYIGAYIHAECFEVGQDVAMRFAAEFPPGVAACDDAGARWHVDLGAAVRADLRACGLAATRIADVGKCTVCDEGQFFSYRASGGTCGRHGAFAVRCENRKDGRDECKCS